MHQFCFRFLPTQCFCFLIVTQLLGAEILFNQLVLKAIKEMPQGGGYATNLDAAIGLRRSNDARKGTLMVLPELAQPSYCSGATYIVFLKAIAELQKRKEIGLPQKALVQLLVKGEADGQGIWGRWNANGPGTAKLLADLKVVKNFEDITLSRPGDFMKIFWSQEIGAKERGHSVIFISKNRNSLGEWEITYWSSNKPDGYGYKTTKAHFIKWCVFSRVTKPLGLTDIPKLPKRDDFLASMLIKDYLREDIRKKCLFSGNEFGQENLELNLQSKNFQGANIDQITEPEVRFKSYIVVKGDNLSELGERFGVSIRSIKEANGIDGSTIRIGQLLKIPAK